jgi:hypothetical protein
MESWMINLGTFIATMIAVFAVMRSKVDAHDKKFSDNDRTMQNIFLRLDKHGDDIVKLNTQSELSMTAKDVDDKYVSKEMLAQIQKNLDAKIDATEKHLIDKVDTLGKSIERGLAQVMANQMTLSDKIDGGRSKVVGG